MKIQLQEKYITKFKVQRDVLLQKAYIYQIKMCAPPSGICPKKSSCQSERTALCTLKGSMTIEASVVFPFFLVILLAFFSLLSQYASAAEMKVLAAAEARKIGVVMESLGDSNGADVTIYKTKKTEDLWDSPFYRNPYVVQSATCRAWIGFTELEIKETYVYITPKGTVYHLSADCTHLKLSIQRVAITAAFASRNEYGEKYKECEICKGPFGTLVYITSEGNRYHSKRSCSGLKRTIRQVPMSEAEGRRRCMRCTEREG